MSMICTTVPPASGPEEVSITASSPEPHPFLLLLSSYGGKAFAVGIGVVGYIEGLAVGLALGLELGLRLGSILGISLGLELGLRLGSMLGTTVGMALGLEDGLRLGSMLGIDVGMALGLELGLRFGSMLGIRDWVGSSAASVGVKVGSLIGLSVTGALLENKGALLENDGDLLENDGDLVDDSVEFEVGSLDEIRDWVGSSVASVGVKVGWLIYFWKEYTEEENLSAFLILGLGILSMTPVPYNATQLGIKSVASEVRNNIMVNICDQD